ncbi:MAG TPA: cytochrome c [Dehalococcoidia bacterium]|jgi:mono/diheme cytochrome c family protein|nr:cytochrome c [Dehalococcoidia bacterium]
MFLGQPNLRPTYMRRSIYRYLFSHIVSISTIVALAACSGTEVPSSTPMPTIQTPPAVDAAIEPASTPGKGSVEGSDLYAANCQVCHGDSNGAGGRGGAPIHNDRGHTWHHPDAQLRGWVLNGKLGSGSAGMPALGDKLTEPEVDAILTFIRSWWTTEQRDSQADVSERYQDALDKQQKR